MSVEPSDQSADWNCAQEALGEIRAYPDMLQGLVSRIFDELDSVVDQLLAGEAVRQQTQRQAEHDALQGQIDRLAVVVAQLAETAAQQERLTAQGCGDD